MFPVDSGTWLTHSACESLLKLQVRSHVFLVDRSYELSEQAD